VSLHLISFSFGRELGLHPALTPQKFLQQQNVQQVLVPPDSLFAFQNPFKLENRNFYAMNESLNQVPLLPGKASYTGHFINEIHWGSVFELNNPGCGNRGSGFHCQILHPHVLPRRKVDP
jgi:hypothetical protein